MFFSTYFAERICITIFLRWPRRKCSRSRFSVNRNRNADQTLIVRRCRSLLSQSQRSQCLLLLLLLLPLPRRLHRRWRVRNCLQPHRNWTNRLFVTSKRTISSKGSNLVLWDASTQFNCSHQTWSALPIPFFAWLCGSPFDTTNDHLRQANATINRGSHGESK